MKKYIFTILAVAAVLSSCSKSLELNEDNNSGANAITTIEASSEITTRAVVSSSDNTKVNWESGDQLGVWGTSSPSEDNLEFTLDGDGGSTTGTFKNGSSSITTISAVMYPYQASASWDGTNSKLICEIPSVQKATKVNSFDKDAAVMYSIGNTTNVQLNYAVNFLKVTVSETNVHAISISSSTTALSGKMEITSSGVSGASSGSLNSVSITAARGEVLQTGDYYIAVKKGDIADPTISYVYLDQTNHTATEKTKVGHGTLSFASGKNVKPISVTDWVGATERKAVQLWENGPYFAKCNVGATTETESGGYYTWGGTYNNNPESQGYVWTDGHYTGTGNIPGSYDTAAKLWNANWRMPTKDEFGSLLSESEASAPPTQGTMTSVTFSGRGTYSSNNIVLPTVGQLLKNNNITITNNGNGYYWSSTPSSQYPNLAALYFNLTKNSGNKTSEGLMTSGQSVRAVLAD